MTVLPSMSTPLPSTAIACGTGAGLFIVMVTLPAVASSLALSNLSAPLGSADSLRSLAPPPDAPPLPVVSVDVVSVVAGGGAAALVSLVAELLDELSLLLPQPVTTRAPAAIVASMIVSFAFIWRGLPSSLGLNA